MENINKSVILDLYTLQDGYEIYSAKQGDKNSRTFTITIQNNGKYYPLTSEMSFKLSGIRGDGEYILEDIPSENVDIVNGIITLELSENIMYKGGIANLQIDIYTEESVLSTLTPFKIKVEKKILDEGAVIKDPNFSALNKAILDCNEAIESANNATNDLQEKLDSHHFLLTEDKDIADGVAGLDSNIKVPQSRLYDSSLNVKGIVQLKDSVTSTSTNTAATPNSVKTTYDKVLTVNNNLTTSIESEKNRASKVESELSTAIVTEKNRAILAESNIQNTINTNKFTWDDKYTKNEIDNKFSSLETATDWKETVNTFSDLTVKYPKPEDGWTVNVKDTDYTYRWSGAAWVAISANAIPKATQSIDGLLSKEDKTSYDDANAKKHTHSNKTLLDGITSALITAWNSAVTHISDGIKHITTSERTNWNDANAKKHTHSNIALLNTLTQALLDKWNSVSDKVDKVNGKGLSTNDYTASEKTKLSGIATGAEVNVQADWNMATTTSDAYIKNKPTSLPASDVYTWAKATAKPTYTPTEVGVIDSTPASGQVAVFNGTTGKLKSSGYTIASSVPSGAKFTDTVYTHPTSDGNKHIPANGTSNGGKYLKSSSTAGSYTWGSLTASDVINALGYTPSSSSVELGAAATQGIANNLTTTAQGYLLDARQGTVIQKSITNIDKKIFEFDLEFDSRLMTIEQVRASTNLEALVGCNVIKELLPGHGMFYLTAAIGVTITRQHCTYNRGARTANILLEFTSSSLPGGTTLAYVPVPYTPKIATMGIVHNYNSSPAGLLRATCQIGGEIQQSAGNSCTAGTISFRYNY